MTDCQVAIALAPPRLTYGDLWALADRMRMHHDLWAGVCSLRATEVHASSDVDAADVYGRGALDHTAKARQFEAMQRLIGRVEGSKIIRDEIKRLADIERAEAAPTTRDIDHVEA